MDAAQIQLLVQNAVQAAIAAVQAQQQPVPPVPVPFAINPAGAGNAPFQFTTNQGMKVFMGEPEVK